MADVGSIARELREALQQQAAVAKRIDGLVAALERESIEQGSSGVLVPYDDLIREWNDRCAKVGMKRRNTAGELKPAMLRVWRKYPNLDSWKAAFDACARNKWWRGEGGWQGNLESFLRPSKYGQFFDEGLGSAAPAPAPSGGLAFGEDAPMIDKVDDEISALLADRARPLPSGIKVKDPREVRGKDDEEFVARLDALKDALAADWRFS